MLMRTTKFILQCEITMHQEYKKTITQNKLKQLEPRFGHLLRPPPGTQRAYSQRKKVSMEVDK